MVALSVAQARRRGPSRLMFAAFVLLGLILSPVTQPYHYVLAVLPVAILASSVQGRGLAWTLTLLVGALLIGGDLPFRSPFLSNGAWALFAYPKLYGAVLLWAIALWLCADADSERLPQFSAEQPVEIEIVKN